MKELLHNFIKEEDGLQVIEVAVITGIAVALILVFQGKIKSIWDSTSSHLDIDANGDPFKFGGGNGQGGDGN